MLMRYDEVMTSGTLQVGKNWKLCLCCVFCVVCFWQHMWVCYTSKTTAHSDVPSRKTLIQLGALFPVLVIPNHKKTPTCAHLVWLYYHSTLMTQGQGEGKVKLYTMNLVAAGSPLTDMGFV